MDTVCAASLCLVAGVAGLALVLSSAAAGDEATRRKWPDNRGYDRFELGRQNDAYEDDDEQRRVYYHRGWMELGYVDRDDRPGPFSRD
jgi:hypothetical protein